MRKLPITKAAGVGLVYGNSILLGKRIYKWKGKPVEFGGHWSIFGGAIEPNETEAECAIRELYEETGIKIDKHQLIPSKKIEHDRSSFTIFFARTHSMPRVKPQKGLKTLPRQMDLLHIKLTMRWAM